MQPTSLARLRIRDLSLPTLVSVYVDWLVGTGAFEAQRRHREAMGIRAIDPRELAAGGDFSHADGVVRTRQLAGRWAMHWRHGDDRRREWHTVARIAELDEGRVRLEHLTGCANSPEDSPPPIATPRTTRWLIEQHARRIEPSGVLQPRAAEVAGSAVDGWLAHVLLDRDRKFPVVIVSTGPDGVLVDPHAVAQKLVGTAAIIHLPDQAASWALRNALEVRGLSAELGCYGGAVRLYRPGLRQDADLLQHPLVLPWKLLGAPAPTRADRVAGLVFRALARDLEAEDWLGTISRIDVKAQRARTEQLVHAPAAVPVEADGVTALRGAIEERDREITTLRAQLVELNALFEHASDELKAAGRRATEAERERDRFEQEADLARATADDARKEAASAHAIDGPVDALRLAASAFGDVLVILDSAYRSAEDCAFRQPKLLFRVLSVLAMSTAGSLPINETLVASCGRQARWKPKDCPQTMRAWGTDREFTSSTGELYENHVTLGHGVKPGSSMQIYYRTLTDGRVEVAYAGTHLRTVSHDS